MCNGRTVASLSAVPAGEPMPERHEEVVCPFCSLACDDLVVEAEGASLRVVANGCPISVPAFARPLGDATPRVGGQPASLEAAVERAAALLASSRLPLFAGLGTDTAGTRAAPGARRGGGRDRRPCGSGGPAREHPGDPGRGLGDGDAGRGAQPARPDAVRRHRHDGRGAAPARTPAPPRAASGRAAGAPAGVPGRGAARGRRGRAHPLPARAAAAGPGVARGRGDAAAPAGRRSGRGGAGAAAAGGELQPHRLGRRRDGGAARRPSGGPARRGPARAERHDARGRAAARRVRQHRRGQPGRLVAGRHAVADQPRQRRARLRPLALYDRRAAGRGGGRRPGVGHELRDGSRPGRSRPSSWRGPASSRHGRSRCWSRSARPGSTTPAASTGPTRSSACRCGACAPPACRAWPRCWRRSAAGWAEPAVYSRTRRLRCRRLLRSSSGWAIAAR